MNEKKWIEKFLSEYRQLVFEESEEPIYNAANTVHKSLHAHHNYGFPPETIENEYILFFLLDYIALAIQEIGEQVIDKDKIYNIMKDWNDIKRLNRDVLFRDILNDLHGKELNKKIYKIKTIDPEKEKQYIKDFTDIINDIECDFIYDKNPFSSTYGKAKPVNFNKEALDKNILKLQEKYYDFWVNIKNFLYCHFDIFNDISSMFGYNIVNHDYDEKYLFVQMCVICRTNDKYDHY